MRFRGSFPPNVAKDSSGNSHRIQHSLFFQSEFLKGPILNLKLKSGDKIAIGRYLISVHLPRGHGRVAVVNVPFELKGRVRVVRKARSPDRNG